MGAAEQPDLMLEFLTALYRGRTTGTVLNLFAIDRAADDPARAQRLEWADTELELADHARRHTGKCVWFGVAPRKSRPKHGRGRAADCAEITALYADIDFDSPNHAPANPAHRPRLPLPPNLESALELVHEHPVAPSCIVHTGGGIQPWWFLDRPVPGDTAVELLAAFGATWAELARRRGWHIDNVFDLARVMRLPGTLNTKSAPPVPVTILDGATWARHSVADLEAHMITPPPAPERVVSSTTPVAGNRSEVPYIGPERAGDAFNAATDIADLLLAHGWHYHSTDAHTGERHYTRPGKEVGAGSSATVYPDNHLIVWSSSTGLEVRRHYDPFGLYAALNHGGDTNRAGDDLRRLGFGARRVDTTELDAALRAGRITPPRTSTSTSTMPAGEIHGWPIDDTFADPTADDTLEAPAYLTRTDGARLFYRGKVNGLIGESGSGKSWVALVACVEILTTGGTVVYIDLEDHPRNIRARLRALGAGAHLARFKYIRPELPAGTTAVEYVDRLIAEHTADLLVIDSVGEAMALQGLKQNDDDDVARWYRSFGRRWAELGPAVLLVDHIPKNTENSKLSPIGSQRKKAATDGAMYRVDQVKPLARDAHGILTLTTAKDRLGTHPNDQVAAQCHFRSSDAGATMTVEITPPDARTETGGVARPTVLMERISRELERGPALTLNNLLRAASGNTAAKRRAVEILISEGYIGTHQTGTQAVYHHSIRPYRNDTVPDDFGPAKDTESAQPVPPKPTDTTPGPGRGSNTRNATETTDTRPYVVGRALVSGRGDDEPETTATETTDTDDDPLF